MDVGREPTVSYLKKSCDGYAGSLTKKYKELEVLMQDQSNREQVVKKYGQLQETYDSYNTRFKEWHSCLDGEEANTALVQFEKNKTNKDEFDQRINEWINTAQLESNDDPIQGAAKDNRSVAQGSLRSHASSVSSVRVKEARAKRALAKLKQEHLEKRIALEEERQKIEQQMAKIEVEREIAEAEAELEVWQENQSVNGDHMKVATETLIVRDQITEPVKDSCELPGKSKLNPEAPTWQQSRLQQTPTDSSEGNLHDITTLFHALNTSVNMPKAEIQYYSGSPTEYWNFTHNFDINVANKLTDDRVKLMYLMQLCVGRARESIECCVLMDPKSGYQKAREILADQYGQPHTIVHALISEILDRPQLKPNDGVGLVELARKMRKCEITLTQMGYTADLNSSDNLLKVQRLMPVHMQAQWAKRAQGIIEKKGVPNFKNMTEFLEEHSKICSNIYGKNIRRIPKEGTKSLERPKQFGSGSRRTAFTTQGSQGGNKSAKGKCYCCAEEHHISMCNVFKGKQERERFKIARKHKLCDNCLKPFHFASNCRAPAGCEVQGCGKRHHTLLHFEPKARDEDTGLGSQPGAGEHGAGRAENKAQATSHTALRSRKVALRVVPVRVYSNNRQVTTWALLDQGSDTSFCEEGLANELGLKGKNERFKLTTVTGTDEEVQGREVSLSVEGSNGGDIINLFKVWTISKIPVYGRNFPSQSDVLQWSHLCDIELPDIEERDVKLLIGSDVPEAFWVIDERRGRKKEPYAILTPLGWTVLGPVGGIDKGDSKLFAVNLIGHDPLQDQLAKFWELDHGLQIHDDSRGYSVEDGRAVRMMEESVIHIDGHYQVGLPWRFDPPSLPNNYSLAENRLKSLQKRLIKDSDFHRRYKACVDEYVSKGHAVEVDRSNRNGESDGQSSAGRVWYLPHHGVTHPLKPEKLRIVFDCSAQYKGVALNDQLLQGPDFTNKVVGVLTRFRQYEYACVGDIEGMFHQVMVSPMDTNALRFLWWQDGDPNKDVVEYKMVVHLFGAKSSPSCAGFALNKTVEDNQQDYDPRVAKMVKDNFYVDDCLASVPTVEEGKTVIPQLCEMLSKGGFRLRKWLSNSKELLSIIPSSERAGPVVDLDLDHAPFQRTLGVLWDVASDTMGFKVAPKNAPLTRRGILSATSSLYDPLGFAAPFTLRAKVLLQDLSSQGLGWDQPVGMSEVQQWDSWLSELPGLELVKIDRCLTPKGFKGIIYDLHVFGDASERAYAASAYLRVVDVEGKIHCTFLIGKSRLSPLRKLTIPRLELSAAALAVTLGKIVQEELRLQVRSSTFWTDSTSVLMYIRNESRRFRTFVANRVAKIHELSEISEWRYVDTHSNPADEGSRGLSSNDLAEGCKWLKGPEFLWSEERFWPQLPDVISKGGNFEVHLQGDLEVKRARSHFVGRSELLQGLLSRYSSWERMKRGIAWILRYKRFLLCRSKSESCEFARSLTVKELRNSEREIVKVVQRDAFVPELKALYGGNDGSLPKGSKLLGLNPILVDGVLRVGGRLKNSPLCDDVKHPIILPSAHQVTKLIIEHHHRLVGHLGAGSTWSAVRNRYWVLRGGVTVRQVIGKCFPCKKRNASVGQQKMADLPEVRVTPDKGPFTNVGLDFFGPLYVKQGRNHIKKYGCIFTCLAVRAVHIELADDLSTDSFINVLRRFMCRRGAPETIYCDNGSNFKGGERELAKAVKALECDRVESFLHNKEISWRFNPPTASHMGGAWERMIRSVRSILRNLLSEQVVTQDVLVTVLTEVEGILNARPLTQLSMDPLDDEPLTPNHLLLMKNASNVPPGVFSKTDSYGRRRWRQSQYLADQFWLRWKREYLPLLQVRQKWRCTKENFKPGDLVLVVEDNVSRGKWSMGRVIQVYPDKAGHVRQVDVRIGAKCFRRPIAKLCLLEGFGNEVENG